MKNDNTFFVSDSIIENIIKSLPFKICLDLNDYKQCFTHPFTESEKTLPKKRLNKKERKIVIILDQIAREIIYHFNRYSNQEIKQLLKTYKDLKKILFYMIIKRLNIDQKKLIVLVIGTNFK